MKIEQIYTGCLAHGAYYIESAGEAAIVDPLRDVHSYIELAKVRNASIKYVFETHFHADFVSGHIDLAKLTGAEIVYGPTSLTTGFKATIAQDNQEFKLGDIIIKLLHTPGHTMESSCYLVHDETGKPVSIFSGDTLFIGDVGRPDLAQHVIADLTQDKLAGHLYNSLRNKIMPLPDDIIVYPGHGAGSACGKNMSKETTDTLGNQKRVNYALNPNLTEEQFKKEVLDGLTLPPFYFPKNVVLNIGGYESVDDVMERALKPIPVNEFYAMIKSPDTLVIDARKAVDFALAFIPGSVNIGIDGTFAGWVGTVVKNINQKIIIVAPHGKETEIAVRLARVGYDKAIGFLEGGINAWIDEGHPVESITMVAPDELYDAMNHEKYFRLIDVRRKSEFDSEHIVGADNLPLDYFEDALPHISKEEKAYVHCEGGYRSMIFLSLLRRLGYTNLIDAGGFKPLKATGKFKTTVYVCPTTML